MIVFTKFLYILDYANNFCTCIPLTKKLMINYLVYIVSHETTIQFRGCLFFKFYFEGFFFKIQFLHVFTITKFVTCRKLNGSHNAYYSTTS